MSKIDSYRQNHPELPDLRQQPEPEQPTRRGRGAPIGNTNAATHGRYTRAMRDSYYRNLNTSLYFGLDGEMDLIRNLTKRVELDLREISPGAKIEWDLMSGVLLLGMAFLLRYHKIVDRSITPEFGACLLRVYEEVISPSPKPGPKPEYEI